MDRRIDPSWGGPLSYFSFHPVLDDWCNKGRGMCYLVCGMVHIKEPLLLMGKSSACGSSGFPLSLSEWYFTICPTPYNHKWNVLNASLNKTFPSFLLTGLLLTTNLLSLTHSPSHKLDCVPMTGMHYNSLLWMWTVHVKPNWPSDWLHLLSSSLNIISVLSYPPWISPVTLSSCVPI